MPIYIFSYLETVLLEDLEPLKNQSHLKAYAKRDNDADDMSRIENGLKGFVDRFTVCCTYPLSPMSAFNSIMHQDESGHCGRDSCCRYKADTYRDSTGMMG